MTARLMNRPKHCVLRITERDRRGLEELLFRRYPRAEWGTFFRFGYRITPWGLHASFVDAVAPRRGDLDERSGIVEFSAGYILRAQMLLQDSQLGVGVIHSHPQDCGTGASMLDNDMDDYFAREFSIYGNGRPYLSLRMARSSEGRFAFSGEAWLGSEIIRVTELFSIGQVLRREPNAEMPELEEVAVGGDGSRARLVELIGERAGILRRATVGIMGCSGLGSPAIHVLVRAGVRRFILVDPKRYAASNLERMHGSVWDDSEQKPPKVDILRRLILSIEPNAEVRSHVGNILDESILDDLLKCDLVLSCTDTQHSRACLGDYANHYLIPCIDGAVLMRAKDGKLLEQVGEIARYTADEPCPWCLGRINQKALAHELMSDEERERRAKGARNAALLGIDGEQYWGDAPPQELTVGYMTTIVGAMQAGYAEMWLTGASEMPHQRFQFDLGMPMLGVVPADKGRRPECSCNHTKGWADQARCDRSVTMPSHWKASHSE